MKKNIIIIGAALILVVGFGSFFGGLKYGQSKNGAANFSPQQFQNLSPEQKQRMSQQTRNGGNFQDGRKGGMDQNGMAFLNGEILSKDDKSLTLKLRDGGSQIVFFTASTTIGKIIEGVNADLEAGKLVTVNGVAGSDGSVVAKSIQLVPYVL